MKEKNINKKTFLSFVFFLILIIIFLMIYFGTLIRKERLEMKRDLEKIVWDSGVRQEITVQDQRQTHPETFIELRESGIDRYFLTEVDFINNSYTPVIHTCLFEKGMPIYPSYVYETWARINYPDNRPEIAIVRYRLLPEDNNDFQPNETCYIKEIKTESDWQEIEQYGFRKDLFY